MAQRKDFLRHIVNRILASSNLPRQVVDDVRRMVGRAEDKYKFHAFGGDIRNLALYLRSPDFNDLVTFLRNIRVEKSEEQPLNVLKKILLEAREAYKDIPEVVSAIDERLRELEGETTTRQDKIEILYRELKSLEDRYRGVKVERDEQQNAVRVSYGDKLAATITLDKERAAYKLAYRLEDELEFDTLSDVKTMLRRLLELTHGRTLS